MRAAVEVDVGAEERARAYVNGGCVDDFLGRLVELGWMGWCASSHAKGPVCWTCGIVSCLAISRGSSGAFPKDQSLTNKNQRQSLNRPQEPRKRGSEEKSHTTAPRIDIAPGREFQVVPVIAIDGALDDGVCVVEEGFVFAWVWIGWWKWVGVVCYAVLRRGG